MTRCTSRVAAKVLKCSKVSQPAAVTVIHRNLPKGTIEKSSFCRKSIVQALQKLVNNLWPLQSTAWTSRPWGCLRCGNAAREVLQDGAEVTVEQGRMFEIPVTWHIQQHSQIIVSPNSQMRERGFILASPYRCHSLCFSRVNPR